MIDYTRLCWIDTNASWVPFSEGFETSQLCQKNKIRNTHLLLIVLSVSSLTAHLSGSTIFAKAFYPLILIQNHSSSPNNNTQRQIQTTTTTHKTGHPTVSSFFALPNYFQFSQIFSSDLLITILDNTYHMHFCTIVLIKKIMHC